MRGGLQTLSIALVVTASGCAAAVEPRAVVFPDAASHARAHIDSISTYRQASATIAVVFERDLRFPSFDATLHFYADRRGLERALIDAGYEPPFARRTAGVMAAVGGHRGVLLNEGAILEMPWHLRIGLLAHELTHTLQYSLGGGRRGASDQWLREGFAEWVAMNVLDKLRAMPMASYRRQKLSELRETRRDRAPRLDEMATFPQMVELAARKDIAPYAQAFLAVDFLIERHGVAGVLRYFQLFAASQDRRGNFAAAFGEDLETFEASLGSRLWPARR